MSGKISPHQLALACGTGGAYIDVTSYVEFGEGIGYGWGRSDQFSDTAPGTFSFTLNNADGRFTPGNTASPLATTVTEGMGVSWLLGGRLVHTSILAVEIPADEATWTQLRVTCDDMLGDAGRHQLTSIADGLTQIYNPVLWWRLDEASGAPAGAEVNGSPLGAFVPSSSNPTTSTTIATFGRPQHPALPGTAVTLTAGAGETTRIGTTHGNTVLKTGIGYPIPTDTSKGYSGGTWGFWVYPGSTINFAVIPYWAVAPGYSDSMQILVTPTSIAVKGGANTAITHAYTAAESTAPHFVSLHSSYVWQSGGSYWSQQLDGYLDGVAFGSTIMQSAARGYTIPTGMLTAGTALQPLEVNFSVTNPGTGTLSGTVQRVVHALTANSLIEQNALLNVEDERRAVLDTLSTELSSAAYNGRPSLSRATIGYPDVANRSVLDVYNDIVRTEQGHLFCTTTGSLTAPVEQIQVRDRDRPATVEAVFDVSTDLDGLPTFVRDITNVAETVTVAGPTGTVTVTDPSVLTVTSRAITGGLSETVLLTDPGELRLWGQDRINRGKNVNIRVQQLTVDAVTSSVTAATLLALVPGDRVQLAGLPAAPLGFTTWDAWILGATETHTPDGARFTFTVMPTLPNPGLTDTALTGNGGDVTLTAAVTATQTSLTVTSTSGDVFSTVTPYDCTLGTAGEQVTVTAVTGNTLTVVRGANGTTAITHTASAPIEVVAAAILAY